MRRQEEAREELIQRVITLVEEKLPPKDTQLIKSFIKQFYLSSAPEDLLERSVLDLYGALVSHWYFIHQRKPYESKIRVYNPQYEQHGWQSTHTVIEVISEHRAFLMESIRMVLNQRGLNVHLILHLNSLKVERDSQGMINNILTNHEKNANVISETHIFIEIDKLSDPKVLEELRQSIENVIEDVNLAVNDWHLMTQKMQAVVDQLQERIKEPKKEVDDEIIDFLKWINKNHFTFLGYCQRKLLFTKGKYQWSLDKDSCLGILKKSAEAYFESFEEMPKPAQDFAISPFPLILGKTDKISTVHRSTYTDFIVIKIFDDENKVIGQHQFIGLYTAAAYNRSPQGIPLLRLRVKQILERANVSFDSHDGKALVNILETLPRDDFFHATVDELYELAIGILHLQERQRIRLFIRKDLFTRVYSCLVYVPRERFNSRLREKMQDILLEELGGYKIDFTIRFSESVLARIHFMVRYKDDGAKEFDVNALQEKLMQVGRTWEDNFKAALVEHFGEEEGNRLFHIYRGAFPVGYRSEFNVRTAVYDVQHIERLSAKDPLEMSFYRPLDEPEGILRFKLYSPNTSIPLSDIIPMLECMGLRVISERPHEIVLKNGKRIWINDFGMVANSARELRVDEIKDIFQEAFYHIWYKEAESDGFNRLVLSASLNWREVTMLRAYAKYLWQIGFTFSQAYIEDVLCGLPEITRDLVNLFTVRFDPSVSQEKRNSTANTLRLKIKNSLEEVKNIDEDRIIRRYLQVILATIRTNYFQKDNKGEYKTYLSIKFDPSSIPELPLPRPLFEIFVYSPRVEGVHLRGAKVARGGLRWSDRREDFRTEVLGLMKAQQVKNAVIVPLGAKGGFVPKTMFYHATREAIMNEGISCYQIFIHGLLDLTDNLVENKVVPPKDVVRYDSDDPYLVVAADKGTATFSDIANNVSKDFNFWLGDAFASGGSSGYDHKKMGITARGAWESVKRHFRELNIDTQKTDFTVIGIGDMAGDVFGNGMLQSRHIKLIGAFNHMHIFLDPNPDPEVSYNERLRLFNLPRSSWEDYDSKLISKGGGVYPRSAKFIPLSKEMQEVLGVNKPKMVANELIRALLKAKVDLLFNGGIGTYVKASFEHNMNVGDRTNDGLRVNGEELRAKVLAEGGNLGFTQLGRVEYALNGGKLNTDAIDNSGGVNCSDLEVNIKILLNGVVEAGDLTEKQRNVLLGEMTDEVAELVLANNRNQTEAISVAEFNAESNVQMHCRLIDHLEQNANLDRTLEFLPSNEELLARQQLGKGLTRPELSVLLAYCKTLLKGELLASDVPEDKYIAMDLVTAFPQVLQDRYEKEMFTHRLKREIIAMQISNSVINDMGLGFIHRLQDETGATVPDIIRGYIAAREIFRANRFREAVEALDFIVPAEIQIKMLHELNRLVRRGTRWFLRHRIGSLNVEEVIKHFTPKMQLVKEGLHHALQGTSEEYLMEFARELMDENVPEETALITAQMGAMFSALDIVDAAISHNLPVENVTITYYAVGARLELGWFREQIKLHPVANHWDSLARAAIRDDLDRQQRNLTVAIMLMQPEVVDVEAQIDAWMAQHKVMIDRWHHMIAELKSLTKREFTMYSVALRELMELSYLSGVEVQQKKIA
ncbi:MAG: NAD-glutamate dehydrogenase [Proteobacteria bacterium]|nr:NAD-glutamate dehydrogenase [Pseudomonadota bacterium]